MELEEWRSIAGYEGSYEVSSLGRVRSLDRYNNKPQFVRGRMMKLHMRTNHGYPVVTLTKDGIPQPFLVHRLVADAFVDNPRRKPQVNHLNGVRKDARASNLEWTTRSENQRHAYETLKRGWVSSHLPAYRGLPKPVVAVSGDDRISFESIGEAQSRGFNAGLVRECLAGKRASYKGYEWRRA